MSGWAVNRICLELVELSSSGPLDQAPQELFNRCGELVFTSDSLNGGTLPNALGYERDDDLLAALQQVNGEEAQAAASFSQNASYEQFSNIAARLGALRGTTGASVTSVAANGAEMMFGSGGGAAADSPFGPWGWFIRGSYVTGDRDPSNRSNFTGAENGFDFDQYGITVGIDRYSGSTVWGFALGYTAYDIEMQTTQVGRPLDNQAVNGGDIETDTISGTFYFDFNSESDVYFSVLAGYGSQTLDMTRNYIYVSNAAGTDDQLRLLTSDPDGDSLAGSMTLGKVYQQGGWVFEPRIGLSYDRLNVDRFVEADSGNQEAGTPTVSAMQLAFDKQTIDSFRVNVGLQFSGNINTGFGSVRPMFSLDYYREFEDDPRKIRVKYALEDQLAADNPGAAFMTGFGGCLSCFELVSDAPDSGFYVVGLGIAATYRNGIQAFLMFESLIDYDNLRSNALTLGLRGHF
ncbi:MAG: autotransporter outer membrane beta-barrel domain-containing protein [Gammaproteobacteria bacterium]|nr:autotransporter outer membrane beta-barrel domain-containing protein [Gammaproteobacteria bacterium]